MKTTFTLGALLCLGLTGCDPVSGELNLSEPINAMVINNTCTPGRSQCALETKIEVPAGSYEAELNMRSSREAVLRINIAKSDREIIFKIPAGKALPEYAGSFALSSKDTQQPLDLSGDLKTTESDSGTYTGTESCSYAVSEYACEKNENGETYCGIMDVYYPGWQDVEYHYHTTFKEMNLSISKPGTSTPSATMYGTHTNNQKVYTHIGSCG